MRTLSSRISSIERLIDIAIIVFVLISIAIIGLVSYGWYTFGLAWVLRNPTARSAISALATCVSTVILVIYTWFTYKLFVSTRASLELSRIQLEDQTQRDQNQNRLQFEREDINVSTVNAINKQTWTRWILIVYKKNNQPEQLADHRDWEFVGADGSESERNDSSTNYSDYYARFKILCIKHAEQFYELEF